jgi:choline dehydrogenase-like flavoprotein
MQAETYSVEYLVVGSGAGGSAAAFALAQSGRSVLVLERGGRLPADGSTISVEHVIRRAAFAADEIWVDRSGRARLQEYFNLGGKTKWYGATLLRLEARDFAADLENGLLDWPIEFEDLVPFYAAAERLMDVRTFAVEPGLRRIVDGIKRSDPEWEEHPQPLGLDPSIEVKGREAKRFDGFALPSGAKSDAETKLLNRILGLPNVRIRTGSEVVDLLPVEGDPTVVSGVVCRDGAVYRARKILLAAGALHSPRLLQRYIRRHRLQRSVPGSDLVGRYYKCHIGSLILAFKRGAETDVLRKTIWLSHPRFPHSSVQSTGHIDGEIIAAHMPHYAPGYLSDVVGTRAYAFRVITEDASHPDNRIIDPATDKDHPKLDYDLRRTPESIAEHRRVRRAFGACLLRQSILPLMKRIAPYSSSHACGTMIAGRSPDASVVDCNGAVWGLQNIYVVDASVMPRSGRVNPALTVYAWSLRVAALLEKRPVVTH